MIYVVWAALLLSGCINSVVDSHYRKASEHAEDIKPKEISGVTLGKIQQHLNVGTSSADVISLIGSPNIVTTDDKRREVWVYDIITTETVHSRAGEGNDERESLFYLLGAGKFNAGSAVAAGATRTSQRNLNVIVKFDKDGNVRDYAYHLMRF